MEGEFFKSGHIYRHISGGASENRYAKYVTLASMECDSTQQHVHVDFASQYVALPTSQWL